jgi:hypothetical protein
MESTTSCTESSSAPTSSPNDADQAGRPPPQERESDIAVDQSGNRETPTPALPVNGEGAVAFHP